MSTRSDDSSQEPNLDANRPLDEVLPPVQPPDAGFILQLFLIPMIIVSIIVTIWLAFSWLAHMGNNPRDLVAELRSADDYSWQVAHTLTEILRRPGNEQLKKDDALAQDLATILETQIDAGAMDEKSVRMRVFLCRAIGEFQVSNVLPALLRAATTQRDDVEYDVRDASIQALAIHSKNMTDLHGSESVRSNQALVDVLMEAANERSDAVDDANKSAEIRSAAAFALGVIGGDMATVKLGLMLDDPYPNTRYNAATGLARHGDERALRVLVEMLDPDNDQVVRDEVNASAELAKRTQVMTSAFRAIDKMIETNSVVNLRELKVSLKKIVASDLPRAVVMYAENLLDKIE